MESRSNIVIVAAFGRGLWLAHELLRSGKSVTYIDVSERLGLSQAEDWNGPFPLLKTTQFREGQWKFLTEDAQLEEVEGGFTFWLNSGPWELSGPLFEFTRKKVGVDPEAIRYVRDFSTISDVDRRSLRQRLENLSGRENWLAHFAHQIAATVFTSDRQHFDSQIPLALFSPCYLRQTTNESNRKKHEELRSAGAKLFQNAWLEDLSVQSRVLDGIEVASERSGIIPGDKFVWMLSGEETRRFNPRVLNALYPDGVVEASWCWVRFMVRISEGPERDVLPQSFVVAKDIHLPWTHANICFMERTPENGVLRAWMRVASGRRFQRSYLTEMGNDLIEELRRRLPAVEVEIHQMPQEFHFGFEELGPPRCPVFLQSEINKTSRTKLKNVHFVCPEDWGALDWGTRMSVENRIYYTLKTEKKEESRNDLALHPN